MATEPMYLAAYQGDAQRIAQLLAEGADPNARADGGTTSLMVAADRGHAAVVAALIDAGAEVNAQDDSGQTALVQAASAGQTEVVALLLKVGADPNIRTGDGRTALSSGKWRRRDFHIWRWMFVWAVPVRPDDRLIRMLLDAGAK